MRVVRPLNVHQSSVRGRKERACERRQVREGILFPQGHLGRRLRANELSGIARRGRSFYREDVPGGRNLSSNLCREEIADRLNFRS
jgi:hypothetical protein